MNATTNATTKTIGVMTNRGIPTRKSQNILASGKEQFDSIIPNAE